MKIFGSRSGRTDFTALSPHVLTLSQTLNPVRPSHLVNKYIILLQKWTTGKPFHPHADLF